MAKGPEGTPTHAGIGIEINVAEPEKTKAEPQPPPDYPVPFDKPPEEPRVEVKLMFIYNLDAATDGLLPPGGFPDNLGDLTFPTPGFEPGESGVGFGIELKW